MCCVCMMLFVIGCGNEKTEDVISTSGAEQEQMETEQMEVEQESFESIVVSNPDGIDFEELPDEEPDTDGLNADTLLSFVRQLPPGYRAVFNLFVIEEKSHKEIAEILHIKPDTSASQFARARRMLAKIIQTYKHKTEDR